MLREQGPFGAGEATLIGLDLCRALSAVHRAGLLHRDIKAHNVMREDGGRIVLMDFGTGLDHADDSDDPAPGLAGTPLYMAPEILDGQEASVHSSIARSMNSTYRSKLPGPEERNRRRNVSISRLRHTLGELVGY